MTSAKLSPKSTPTASNSETGPQTETTIENEPTGAPDQGLKSRLNDPGTIRILQFAVAIMGAILVIGFAVVASRIIYLATRTTTPVSSAVVGTAATGNTNLALPQGAHVTTMSLSGDHLAVHINAPTGDEIHIINTRTGAIERIITISPSVPTR